MIFQFFINFLQWSTIWTIWILATVAALIGINTSNPSFDINPQMIAILVLYEHTSHFYLYTFLAHVKCGNAFFFLDPQYSLSLPAFFLWHMYSLLHIIRRLVSRLINILCVNGRIFFWRGWSRCVDGGMFFFSFYSLLCRTLISFLTKKNNEL